MGCLSFNGNKVITTGGGGMIVTADAELAERASYLSTQAKDDPLIPFSVFDHPAFRNNPRLRLVAVDHGGHLGFIARRRPRFWLDGVVMEWVHEIANKQPASLVS